MARRLGKKRTTRSKRVRKSRRLRKQRGGVVTPGHNVGPMLHQRNHVKICRDMYPGLQDPYVWGYDGNGTITCSNGNKIHYELADPTSLPREVA